MVDQPIRDWNGLLIPEPGRYTLDEAHKRIGFTARHMMVSPVRGEFAKATARIVVAEDPLRSAIAATIHADSVNTHNPERDAHLSSADFLDVVNYPTLEYRSTGISWQEGNDSIFYWARLRLNGLIRRIPRSNRYVLTPETSTSRSSTPRSTTGCSSRSPPPTNPTPTRATRRPRPPSPTTSTSTPPALDFPAPREILPQP